MVNGLNDGKNFLILDLETTGLDPLRDRIIEVAWTTTKGDLAMPMSVFSRVISNDYTRAALQRALPVVQEMHKATGLWDEVMIGVEGEPSPAHHDVVASRIPVVAEILGHLDARSSEGETWHLLGASVHFDRAFIDNWMPTLSKCLHHRILDTSSLKLLAGAAGLVVPEPDNPLPHRAANDVREALAYAQTFRNILAGIPDYSMDGVSRSDIDNHNHNVASGVVAAAHDPKRMRGII